MLHPTKKQELGWYKKALSVLDKREAFGNNGVCDVLRRKDKDCAFIQFRDDGYKATELLPLLNSKRTETGSYFFNNNYDRVKALKECIFELQLELGLKEKKLNIEIAFVAVLLILCIVAAYALCIVAAYEFWFS